jgi:uncharacterized protein
MNSFKLSKFNNIVFLNKDIYLLFNSATGAIDIINKETLGSLKNLSQLSQNKKDLISCLIDRGYLVEDLTQQETKLKFKYEIFHKNLLEHPSFTIIPTYDCCLRCTYCYEKTVRASEEYKTVINEEKLQNIFRIIDNLVSPNQKHIQITLFGGEPFLLKNKLIIEKIIKEGSKRNAIFNAYTNGIELKHFQDILKLGSFEKFIFTLDGPPSIHNQRRIYPIDREHSFAKTIESIEFILNKNYAQKIKINIKLDQENIDHIQELADFIKMKRWHRDKRIEIVCSNVVYACKSKNEISLEELIEYLFKRHRNIPDWLKIFKINFPGLNFFEKVFTQKAPVLNFSTCLAHEGGIVFDPCGRMFTCPGIVIFPEQKIGEYFPKIKFSHNILREWHRRNVFSLKKCRECKYKFLCGGGCAYLVYQQYRKIDKPICPNFPRIIKYLVPNLFNYYKEQNIPRNK